MKNNYTHISVVIDKSGSMASMVNDVIGGFNSLVEDQTKEEGEATMTIVQFNNNYEVISDFTPIKDATKLNKRNFVPNGGTALLDAMGKTMNNVRERINSMPEDQKPSKAIFVFITDGEENTSSEYNRDRVFEMISDLKSEDRGDSINWEFVFIGANQDAIQAGGNLGIRSGATLTYDASSVGATTAFRSLSAGLTGYRKCKSASAAYSFSQEDRKAQEDLLKSNEKFAQLIPTHLTNILDVDLDKK